QADEEFLTLLMNHTEACWTNTDLHVNDFCKSIGCSKSQLYRKLMSLTGESLNSFIKEYRLNRALLLLSRLDGNVSEIAYETGFSSPSYFSKCFQKRFEQSPSDWLATHAG
ncbi:MAG: helix-turn-helix transcriptional regulator, partial [Chitinophagales bacterium]